MKIFQLIILMSLIFTSSSILPLNRKKVLLINSYSFDQKWTNDITAAVKQDLESENVQVLVEFLDTKRHNSEEYYISLLKLFKYKYRQADLDLIITSDDNAINFVLNNRQSLFPHVPLVFCGVNNLALPERKDFSNMAGTLEVPDFENTIHQALTLHPEMNSLYIINESNTSGQADRELLNNILRKFHPDLKIHWLEDYTDEQLASKLKSLHSKSFILLLSFFPNKEANVFSMEEGAEFISQHTTQPVYSMWEYFLGHGIVGGKLTSGTYQGKEAVRIAKLILEGRSPDEIPVTSHSSNHFMFDYNQFKRFGISIEDLPSTSVIINKPDKSILEIYSKEIAVTITVILLLTIICLMLLRNIHFRHKAEKQLNLSLHEKNTLLNELYHRTKNNMQVVSSFLYLESSLSTSDETIVALKEAGNRIEAMSLVHQMLYKSQNLTHISARDYITELVNQIHTSYYSSTSEITYNLDILDTAFVIDTAIPLGLILNELLSNVYKHAFPENKGEVTITLKEHKKSYLKLLFKDNGAGFSKDYDFDSSLGLSTIKNLVTHQLNGTLSRTSQEGTEYTIIFKLDIYKGRV